jgi:tight adherence protein C
MTGLLVGFFLFVFVAVATVMYWFETQRPAAAPQGDTSARSLVEQALQAVGEALPQAAQRDPSRRLLAAAGFRNPNAVKTLQGIRTASALLLGLLLALIAGISRQDWFPAFLALLAGAGFGYLLPERVLGWMISARKQRIRMAVPPALDLMVMCVEAGQSLNQAIVAAANELKDAFPDLSAELSQASLELRAGKSRAEALLQLGERNQEPELKRLAGVLVDSDRFGTSLAPALRVHARYLRLRTRQQAQEAARKVAVKLVFPVFFLIFPSVLLVTLAPAVIQILKYLKGIAG